ncbi:MAG: Transcription termination protein NusA [uncultured Campylobacterales bacterium]|uniref:Transcription termination/antitermination protein NusA n=1 Tax=uncultured Campylobacterales bacterium TaxID=352960 RepID=A0A6S6SC74_9BACT|nr:MAG: Transcription termination protein NusA [uncultured Campylobacterales bacterium]
MNKIETIIASIANEKNLKIDDVLQTVKNAITKTAKDMQGYDLEFKVIMDEDDKTLRLYQVIEVVSNEAFLEYEEDERQKYIALDEAREVDPELDIEDKLTYEIQFEDFGRTGISRLNRELEFHIQRLLEDKIYEKFQNKVGSIINGIVVQVDEYENTFIEIDEVRAMLPQKNRIKGESFNVGDTVKSVVRKVHVSKSQGIVVELSRTTPQFLEALLELEVPEISDGSIEIMNIARIPGLKAKVSLLSHKETIDPIGATVGVRGVRIMAVSEEISNENIDCIKYSESPEIYIIRALSPAVVNNVTVNSESKKAIVNINENEKSRAIGKSGVNVRLASMLTGYEISFLTKESTGEQATDTQTESTDNNKNALEELFN